MFEINNNCHYCDIMQQASTLSRSIRQAVLIFVMPIIYSEEKKKENMLELHSVFVLVGHVTGNTLSNCLNTHFSA